MQAEWAVFFHSEYRACYYCVLDIAEHFYDMDYEKSTRYLHLYLLTSIYISSQALCQS